MLAEPGAVVCTVRFCGKASETPVTLIVPVSFVPSACHLNALPIVGRVMPAVRPGLEARRLLGQVERERYPARKRIATDATCFSKMAVDLESGRPVRLARRPALLAGGLVEAEYPASASVAFFPVTFAFDTVTVDSAWRSPSSMYPFPLTSRRK